MLHNIPITVLFERNSIRGAFGLPTDPPNMKSQEKRPLGRWSPLSGDKFIKSKVGKVLHTPIPGTPRIGAESEECESLEEEGDCESVDEQIRQQSLGNQSWGV